MTSLKRGDGVMMGDYHIVVYAYEPHPGEPSTREEHEQLASKGEIERGFIIPEKYTRPDASGLSDTVDGNHSGFIKLELNDD